MSHHLSFKKGKAQLAYAGKLPWHKHGVKHEGLMTAAEVLELAQLDYQVGVVPTYIPQTVLVPGESTVSGIMPELQPITTYVESGYRSIIREDNNTILGHCSPQWHPVQNRDCFKFFDEIIDRGEAIYETAGALFDGKVSFMCAKLPAYIEMPGGDITELFVVVVNDFSGSGAIKAVITPIRTVCWNTLSAGILRAKSKVSIRHGVTVEHRLSEAHKILGLSNKLQKELEEVWSTMKNKYVSDVTAKELLTKFFVAEIPANLKDLSTRAKNKIDGAWLSYMDAPGADPGNAYGLLQGLTHYLSHTKNYRTEDHRMKSLVIDGKGLKKANDLVLELV